METTKPKWVLHSTYRSKCLGITAERYAELCQHMQIGLMFQSIQSETRGDGISSLSVLLSNVWDTFKPQNNEEAHAVSFTCGTGYEKSDYRETALALSTVTSLVLMLMEKSPEYFAKNANYPEFFNACIEYLGEPPAVEHEVTGGIILEDLTLFNSDADLG